MKRIFSLILTLCLLSALCIGAYAQENVLMELGNGYNVVLPLEEEVEITPEESYSEGLFCWIIDDGKHTPVKLSIAPTEIGGEISLADYTEEEQMQLGDMAGAMFDEPEIHLDTTPSGNLYLHICSNEQSDMDMIFTIYKGYFVELLQHKDDFSQLSEEDNQFCLDILHAIEFEKDA